MRFKCIFFDFDGVIVENSQQMALDSLSEVLVHQGISIPPKYFTEHCLGLRAEPLLDLLNKKFGLAFDQDTIQQIRKLHKQKLLTESKLGNNLKFVLEQVSEKYICSSSDINYINQLLKQLNVKNYFPDQNIFYPKTAIFQKPNPFVYLSALKIAKTNTDAACAIEDSSVGVTAAKAAGLYTIGYVGEGVDPRFRADLLTQAGADEIIYDFSDLT